MRRICSCGQFRRVGLVLWVPVCDILMRRVGLTTCHHYPSQQIRLHHFVWFFPDFIRTLPWVSRISPAYPLSSVPHGSRWGLGEGTTAPGYVNHPYPYNFHVTWVSNFYPTQRNYCELWSQFLVRFQQNYLRCHLNVVVSISVLTDRCIYQKKCTCRCLWYGHPYRKICSEYVLISTCLVKGRPLCWGCPAVWGCTFQTVIARQLQLTLWWNVTCFG